LGDLEGARTLLDQATASDATSPEYAYRHARVLEDLDLLDAAIQEYCRSIALGAADAGILDSRERLDVLYEIVRERISERALSAFVSGLREADAGLYAESAESFAVAIEETPDWAAAVYNRAIVLERLGRVPESLAEYRRYLELTPTEVDPVVVDVSARIGALEGALAQPTPNPGSALALGVLFPGMGQYYAGRSLQGTIVLSAAGAAVLAGLVFKEVTVRCLVPVASGEDCPPGETLDETSRRPYMGPALIATGAVMVGGAIEAYLRARRARAEQAETVEQFGGVQTSASRGWRVTGPSISTSGSRLDLNLLGLSFR
jgi:tetratricopeptide (TPR) repeat protein